MTLQPLITFTRTYWSCRICKEKKQTVDTVLFMCAECAKKVEVK